MSRMQHLVGLNGLITPPRTDVAFKRIGPKSEGFPPLPPMSGSIKHCIAPAIKVKE